LRVNPALLGETSEDQLVVQTNFSLTWAKRGGSDMCAALTARRKENNMHNAFLQGRWRSTADLRLTRSLYEHLVRSARQYRSKNKEEYVARSFRTESGHHPIHFHFGRYISVLCQRCGRQLVVLNLLRPRAQREPKHALERPFQRHCNFEASEASEMTEEDVKCKPIIVM
jgi:hypothetical protein